MSSDAACQIVIAALSLLIAIVSLIFSILSYIAVKTINGQQIRREEYNYLLSKIVIPYNLLETDMMLLAQGTFDKEFTKDKIDKEALLFISEAKNYALINNNTKLFDYLDGLITGKSEEDIGGLIDNYFLERDKVIKNKSSLKRLGPGLRDKYLEMARNYRDGTIEEICKLVSYKRYEQ